MATKKELIFLARKMKNENKKEFVMKFADLGQVILGNPFVTKTIASLDTDCENSFDVILQGQKIKKKEQKIKLNPACR